MTTSPLNFALIEPNHFVYFACVVRHSSFTAAAKEVGVSKSKLSRLISKLEDSVGVRLLNRTSRSVAVTDAGGLLYQYCVDVYLASLAAYQIIDTAKKNSLQTS